MVKWIALLDCGHTVKGVSVDDLSIPLPGLPLMCWSHQGLGKPRPKQVEIVDVVDSRPQAGPDGRR
jgi:hypothetical protein